MSDLQQLRLLANLMADGTATRADAARLSALLRDHPELRDTYLHYVDTHAALCWEFRDVADAMGVQRPSSVSGPGRHSVFTRRLPWVVVIAASVVVAVALLRFIEIAPNNASQTDSIAALLVDETGAEFAVGRGPEGVCFGPGDYELLKGIVHLRFAHGGDGLTGMLPQGAELVLSGPARLAVLDLLHVRLAYGKVRVAVPPASRGFTVLTSAAAYVDLGTEFGLRVEPGGGASDLYVFDGQVNVQDARSGKVLSEVFEGKSSRHIQGVASAAPELKANDFPTPDTIGFARWQTYESRLPQDLGLIAFFPFRRAADAAVLKNAQNDRAVGDGRIAGARWVSGRWAEKEALLFDRDADFVQLDVPGEYRELTIAAWVKLDRLDFDFNALLNSDRSPSGGVHFQLSRQGLPRGGLLGNAITKTRDSNETVPMGQWAQVASVISVPERMQRTYVNGKMARERHFREDGLIRPGSCRLGNWLPSAGWSGTRRALRGRIDELAIWNRALPEGELRTLFEAGRPRLLWERHAGP